MQRQVGDEAQDDDFTLQWGEFCECRNEVDVEASGPVGCLGMRRIGDDDVSVSTPTTDVVDAPPMSDGEHPAAKVMTVAVEAVKVAGDTDEDVTEQVLRLVDSVRPEVSEHGTRKIVVTGLQRRRPCRFGIADG